MWYDRVSPKTRTVSEVHKQCFCHSSPLWMRLELIQLVVFLGCRLQLKEIALCEEGLLKTFPFTI